MKNSFKIGVLISGIAISALACDPAKPVDNKTVAIDTPQKNMDTVGKTTIDTIKKDTVKKQ